MATDTIACTKCGHSNPADAHDCEQCGLTLQLVAAKQTKSEPEEAPQPSKPEPDMQTDMISCPKCGQPTSAIADDCMKCGVIFAKFFDAEAQRLQEDPDAVEELEQLKQTMDDYRNLHATPEPDAGEPPKTDDIPDEKAASPDDEAVEDTPEAAEIEPPPPPPMDSEALDQLLRPKPNLQRLLKPYCDQIVGMNVESPTAIKEVRLISANDDFFTVLSEDTKLVCSFPYANIVSVTEAVDSVSAGPAKNQAQFSMIVRVSHRVV